MPDWTRADLRGELHSHGHQYLQSEPGRANDFIQRAVEELVGEHDFPFRERSELVIPGEPVTGLGRIEQVTREDGYVLEPARRSDIQEWHGMNPETGAEARYYYQWGQDTIYTYPATEDTLAVHHFSLICWVGADDTRKVEADDDLDKPIVPVAYRDVILLLARIYAKEDVDSEQADVLRGRYEERLDDMRSTLIHRQVDEPMRIRVTGSPY